MELTLFANAIANSMARTASGTRQTSCGLPLMKMKAKKS